MYQEIGANIANPIFSQNQNGKERERTQEIGILFGGTRTRI